jgi:hypothetical protein
MSVNVRARMPALLRLPYCRFDLFTKFGVWDFRLVTSLLRPTRWDYGGRVGGYNPK